VECELSPNKAIQLHGEMGMSDELIGHDVKRILAINAQLGDRAAYHLMCDA
jgi:hypothetical protein